MKAVAAALLLALAALAHSHANAQAQAQAQHAAPPEPPPVTRAAPITPPEHVRGVEQTFLTYPEWFLVFSPAEYAQYVARAQPGRFPFMGHIAQFWQSYKAVYEATRDGGYPPNPGYHVMVMVIGVSTTVEYAIRGAYESLVGRLVEAICGNCRTPEDAYAAKGAQDYVDFIRVLPWYEFDFTRLLVGLWADVPPNPKEQDAETLRKWERRLALSTEYAIKAGYGRLIKLATQAAYDPALLETAVVVSPAPQPDPALPAMKVIKHLPDGGALVLVPRYDAFNGYAQGLARQGVEFREVAGNNSVMLVSLIGASGWRPATGIVNILFEQPILTQPGRKRVVATVNVRQLGPSLREWSAGQVQVEHLFDY